MNWTTFKCELAKIIPILLSKISSPGPGSGLGSGKKMWIPLDPDSQHCCIFKLQCYDFFSFWYLHPCLRTKHSCNKLSLVMILPQKVPGNYNINPAGRQDVHVCCGAEGEVWFGQARRRHFCTPRKEDCSVILQGHLQVDYIELIVIKIWSGKLFRKETVFWGAKF
jgi:hypothetical protein